MPHAGPGCEDGGVAACVCLEDESCCNDEWRDHCVELVDILDCGNCGTPVEQCCVVQESPTCDVGVIDECVCNQDPFCCEPLGFWDAWCVATATLECGLSCDPLPGDCCQAGMQSGCEEFQIVDCVCSDLPACCTEGWFPFCVEHANLECGAGCF